MTESSRDELGDYSVEIERWFTDMDFAFAYKGLPNDMCQAHHMGYVVSGKLSVRMADGSIQEFEAGDAYVLEPAHLPMTSAGSEFISFTPTEEAKAMMPVVQANMMKYAAEHGIRVGGV